MYPNLCRYAFISCLVHSVWSQGSAQLTFSSNPVYSQDRVTLTCSWVSGVVLSLFTFEASDATPKGSLSCSAASPTCATGIGVFTNTSVNGWPIAAGTTSASLTLTAAPSLELNYSCAVTVVNATVVYTVTSEPAFLQVQKKVCPSTPMFQPNPVAFIDNGNGNVICEARNGKPAALVSLTVSDIRGRSWASENVTDLATQILPQPLSNFHNATVTCRVTNHICSNMSVTTVVFTTFNTSAPDVVCTNKSNVMLNCSKHIWSYPGILYKWTVPEEANVNGSLDVESLTVSQGQSGSFNCTATNNYSMASVVIIFTVSNVCHPITTPILTTVVPPCDQCWIIGLVLGIIAVVIIAVVLGVLCKRGHFSKGKNKPGVVPGASDQRSDNGNNHGSLLYVYDGPTSWKTSTEHGSDADAFHLVDRHTQASGDVASRQGLAPSTSNAPAQDRHYMEDIRKPIRLLIVAEGVVAKHSLRTLRTTAVVEYSDRSCSLNDILEKVEQAVPQSSPKFKSVALLLRPAKVGMTVSEVDQADLNASSIQKEKGEKLRSFLARLAKICLDGRGGTRMDILNYNGKAPVRLSEGLTNLLGIPTTVSRDYFGVETPTDDKGGHAFVADDYFDRSNHGDVVYAELEQPSVKPQSQPRPAEERVIYSEIKR